MRTTGPVVPGRGSRALGVWVLGVAAPLAVAASWIPLRDRYSNIDVALALVVTVMGVGTTGSVPAALAAAASAAWWFDFFDTKPYAQPLIARRPDLVTFLVLAAVGGAAGVTAARSAAHRRRERAGGRDLQRLREVAGLVATGDELVDVIGAIAAETASLLGADGCTFDTEAPAVGPSGTARVERNGTLTGWTGADAQGRWKMALPVWAQGLVVGHLLVSGRGPAPAGDRLVVAVALADQAGAALAAYGAAPLPPDPGGLTPRLRLVTGAGPTAPPPSPAPGKLPGPFVQGAVHRGGPPDLPEQRSRDVGGADRADAHVVAG